MLHLIPVTRQFLRVSYLAMYKNLRVFHMSLVCNKLHATRCCTRSPLHESDG